MTQKQIVFAGIAAAILLLAYVLWSNTAPATTGSALSTGSNTQVDVVKPKTESNEPLVEATPDATVDAIIADMANDEAVLDDEIASEKAAVDASSTEINNLTQTYDETQL